MINFKFDREQEFAWRHNHNFTTRDGEAIRQLTEKERIALGKVHSVASGSVGQHWVDVKEKIVDLSALEERKLDPEYDETDDAPTITRRVRIRVEKQVRAETSNSFWHLELGEFKGSSPPTEYLIIDSHRNLTKLALLKKYGIVRDEAGNEISRTNIRIKRKNGQVLNGGMCRWPAIPLHMHADPVHCKCSILAGSIAGRHHPTCPKSAVDVRGIAAVVKGDASPVASPAVASKPAPPNPTLSDSDNCPCKNYGTPSSGPGSKWIRGSGEHHPNCAALLQWKKVNPGRKPPVRGGVIIEEISDSDIDGDEAFEVQSSTPAAEAPVAEAPVAEAPVAVVEAPVAVVEAPVAVVEAPVAETVAVAETPKTSSAKPTPKISVTSPTHFLVDLRSNEVVRAATSLDMQMAEKQNPGDPVVKLSDTSYGIVTTEEAREIEGS